jgi:diaminopimelate epimerase
MDHNMPDGINVNFVEKRTDGISVRTYERGVEDETLSCGTGVTSSALVAASEGYKSPVQVETPGGKLEVEFVQHSDELFTDVFLKGPARFVFEGNFEI